MVHYDKIPVYISSTLMLKTRYVWPGISALVAKVNCDEKPSNLLKGPETLQAKNCNCYTTGSSDNPYYSVESPDTDKDI